MIELRTYQQEAVDGIINGFEEFDRQLAVMPTAAGKTIVIAKTVEHFQPERTLVLAHREELLAQARDKILAATGITAEIEAAGARASLEAPIVVASVQTLARDPRRDRWPAGHFKLVIVDEAHHALAASYQRILGHFEDCKILGVTATPDRGDKRLLAGYFQNVAYEVGLVDLVKQGWLSRIRVKTVPLRIDLRGVHTVAGDYSPDEAGHAIEPHLGEIASVIARDYAKRKSLVFLPLCSLSERFAELCRERGLAAEHVDGASSDRQGTLQRFRSGATTLVCNAMLWTEGFDEPSIDCVIPLRPTKIRSLYAQQVGRGARIHSGKTHLLILDFLWISRQHDIIGPAALVASGEDEAAMVRKHLWKGDGEPMGAALMGALSEAGKERLRKLAEQLETNRRRRGEDVDLLELAAGSGDPELAGFEPVFAWHRDPVTPRQSEFLERAGINPAAVKGRGHASAIIKALIERRNAGLCSFKQIKLLRRFRIPEPHALTGPQASELIGELLGSRERKRASSL